MKHGIPENQGWGINVDSHSGGVATMANSSYFLANYGIGINQFAANQGPAMGVYNNIDNLSYVIAPDYMKELTSWLAANASSTIQVGDDYSDMIYDFSFNNVHSTPLWNYDKVLKGTDGALLSEWLTSYFYTIMWNQEYQRRQALLAAEGNQEPANKQAA